MKYSKRNFYSVQRVKIRNKELIRPRPAYLYWTLYYIFFSEINKVRVSLFHLTSSKEPFVLPSGEGAVVTLSEKVFVPVKDHPDVSIKFWTRILQKPVTKVKTKERLIPFSNKLLGYQQNDT